MNLSNNSKKREPDTMIRKFPCTLCPKIVIDNDNAVLCDQGSVLNVTILIILITNI